MPGTPNGQSRADGLGDTTYQAFFSPKESFGGWFLGAGPQFQLPTNTDDVLGNERWGVGPAAVALIMPGNWVTGTLATQMWSFTNSGKDEKISQFLIQPFVNYNFDGGWYLNTSPVITSNWEAKSSQRWTVPVGGGIGRIMKLGKQPVNLRASFYYNAAHPDNAPEYNMQVTVTLLFPK